MMKKILLALIIACALSLAALHVSADTPYTTWARGPGGSGMITQDAYSPAGEIELDISEAEDMFITPDGSLYIADTGKARVIKVQDGEVIQEIGGDVLQGPTGLFVDEQGVIYVADGAKNEILIFDRDGKLLTEFGRPVEPLFGKNREFLPRKIAVDARKNLYIISEGSVNGIVQMNTNGNFIGYFGANQATMSLKMVLQRMFLTKDQLEQFVKNDAASPSNLAIDNQGMTYTITAGTAREKVLRKFTVSGKNVIRNGYGSTTFRDVNVSENGLLVAVDAEGKIFEMDTNGTWLFLFGALDKGDQRLGALRNPTAIARYGEMIYVLDKDKNAIVTYQTTAFARQVHDGVRLYMNGFYAEAKPYFEQVLNANGSFIMAYQGIADAYFKAGDYQRALNAYRYAEDRHGYSQAYWELRNQFLQQYLSGALIGLFGLWVVQSVVTRTKKRYRYFDPIRLWLARLGEKKWVDDLVFMFRFIKQPADSFYYIKRGFRGSMRFAILIYVWVVVARVLTLYVTGFTFNPNLSRYYVPVEREILYTLGLIVLWNAANYLISTISDGEGRVRDVIIGSAYSLFPYVLLALPIALVSNVLTENEVFIFKFSQNLMWVWVGIMLFLMVKEIHNYSISETIRNILLTLFTMALFVLTGYILYVLFTQLFDFVSAILQEIRLGS